MQFSSRNWGTDTLKVNRHLKAHVHTDRLSPGPEEFPDDAKCRMEQDMNSHKLVRWVSTIDPGFSEKLHGRWRDAIGVSHLET